MNLFPEYADTEVNQQRAANLRGYPVEGVSVLMLPERNTHTIAQSAASSSFLSTSVLRRSPLPTERLYDPFNSAVAAKLALQSFTCKTVVQQKRKLIRSVLEFLTNNSCIFSSVAAFPPSGT